jgi:hypothetical protein
MWTRGGFTIVHKRLSKGRFRVRVSDQFTGHVEMDAKEFALLLAELSFVHERVDAA